MGSAKFGISFSSSNSQFLNPKQDQILKIINSKQVVHILQVLLFGFSYLKFVLA